MQENGMTSMKFVLINHRTPSVPSACARCSCLLHVGYLRELSTRKQYCGLDCYLDNRVGDEPFLAPLDVGEAFEFAMDWQKSAVDHMSALLGIT
jgi:hypothetical protein